MEIEKRDYTRSVLSRLPYMSVRDIAEELGVPAQEVLRIKRDALENQDALTLEQRRTLAVLNLERIAADAMHRATEIGTDSEEMRNYGPTITGAVQAIKTVLAELRSIEKNTASEVARLNELRVQELKTLVSRTLDRAIPEIAATYSLPEEEIYNIFMKNFTQEALEMEERNLGE